MNNIFAELVKLYDVLAADNKVPPFGFVEQPVFYEISIDDDGTLLDIRSEVHTVTNENNRGKKIFSVPMLLPLESRTSRPHPYFVVDNTDYIFGFKREVEKEGHPFIRADDCHKAYIEHNKKMLAPAAENGAVKAFFAFLDKYTVDDFINSEMFAEFDKRLYMGRLVFFTSEGYLHDQPEVKEIWMKYRQTEAEKTSESITQLDLVTGQPCKPALLHPAIRGVPGLDKGVGKLVCFNYDSCKSYGYKQGENAPMSDLTAFKYATALNYLLNRKNNHYIQIGKMAIVFWERDKEYGEVCECINAIKNNPDDGVVKSIRSVLEGKKVRAGFEKTIDREYFILGLSGAKTVVVPRFFYSSTFGDMLDNLLKHYDDMTVATFPDDSGKYTPYTLFCAATPNNRKKDNKKDFFITDAELPFTSQDIASFFRSILFGKPYPRSFYQMMSISIENQINCYAGPASVNKKDTKASDDKSGKKPAEEVTEKKSPKIMKDNTVLVFRSQAAFIQAYLLREKLAIKKQDGELDFMDESTKALYLIGRQVAIVEEMQIFAHKKLDKPFSVARSINGIAHYPASNYWHLDEKFRIAVCNLSDSYSGFAEKYGKQYLEIGASLAEIPVSALPFYSNSAELNAFALGYSYQRNLIIKERAEKYEESETDEDK